MAIARNDSEPGRTRPDDGRGPSRLNPKPAIVETALLGRCEGTRSGEDSKNGRCLRQGSLRVISGQLSSHRAKLCDWCAARAERGGYSIRTVTAAEVG